MQIYNLYTAIMCVQPNNFPKSMIYRIFAQKYTNS
jgi:hypothetical protein